MATRTIVGKVYNLLDQPVQGAKLKFILNLSTFTADKEYQSSFTETITDAFGNWSVSLWCNSESLSVTSYTCVDVDGSRFIFTLDPGITPLTYSQIKSLGAPINSPPSSLLGLIGTQVALKADQTALISGLSTKVNSVDLTTALSLKADQTALTSGLILKANATESIRLDSAIVLKADQTALISALATKVNSTDLTTALSLKADQTALISALATKVNSTDLTTALSLKADQTALISALATKVNSTDLTTALSLKADQTALTSGLILKANATESIRLDSAIALKADQTALISALATKVNSTDLTTALLLKADQTALTNGLALKADQTALISALATKVNSTDLTTALSLKADQTALTNGLALKQNINFPNGRGSISLVQSVGQNMPGGYVYNKYIFGTTIKDTLNEWNSANSFYTATQTGLYLLTIGLDSDNNTSRKFSIMMDYLTSTEIITLFDIQSGGRTISTSMFYWTANTQVYFTNRCPDTFNTIPGNTFLKIERIL